MLISQHCKLNSFLNSGDLFILFDSNNLQSMIRAGHATTVRSQRDLVFTPKNAIYCIMAIFFVATSFGHLDLTIVCTFPCHWNCKTMSRCGWHLPSSKNDGWIVLSWYSTKHNMPGVCVQYKDTNRITRGRHTKVVFVKPETIERCGWGRLHWATVHEKRRGSLTTSPHFEIVSAVTNTWKVPFVYD